MKALPRLITAALISVLALQPFLLPSRSVARADEAVAAEATDTASPGASMVTDDAPPGTVDQPIAPPGSLTPTDTSAPCDADHECQAPVPGAKPAQPEPEPSSTPATGNGSATPAAQDSVASTTLAQHTIASSTPAIPAIPDIETSGSSTPATTTALFPNDWPFVTAPATTTASTTDTVGTTTVATTTGPTIQSGQAVALANILNILNTNVVNSVGNAFLLNFVNPVDGTVDLRGGMTVSSTSAICALFSCTGQNGLSVNLAGDAGIKNAVVLSATSGGNEIDHANGGAAIQTGDAYAGLNLINVANTNIVDSNYLLLTMNAFQGVNGDIVFPSLSNFLSSLAHNLSPGNFTSTGTATVDNHVTTDAQTGGNETSSTTASTITTGAGASTGNVFNQLNSDMLGGATVSILFRVQGNWAGQVFGAPPGLEWTQGPNGTIALFNTPGSASSTQTLSNLSEVTASSTGDIANDINVIALTGQNKIHDANTALITTGNALASANVLNVANTNVVGKNWILAIVNIFGDFTGNIAFGRPDLWAGEQVSVPSNVSNGSQVTYKYTVINNGDSIASDVHLNDAFDAAHISIATSSVPYTTDASGNLVWSLGDIPAGGAVEVTYQGTVQNAGPGTNITNTIHAAEHETDNNLADNTDTATVSIPQPGGGSYMLAANQPAKELAATSTATTTVHLSITRTPIDTVVRGTGSVHQVITLTNDGDAKSIPLSLHDLLHAPDGSVVNDASWNIGSLDGGESVQLAYDASFAANAPSGTYALSTELYDAQGNLLGTFDGNGHITRSPASPLVAAWHALMPHAVTKVVAASADASATPALPDVQIAHAANAGSQAAAAGLVQMGWPYLLALAILLLAMLFLTAARNRRLNDRGED